VQFKLRIKLSSLNFLPILNKLTKADAETWKKFNEIQKSIEQDENADGDDDCKRYLSRMQSLFYGTLNPEDKDAHMDNACDNLNYQAKLRSLLEILVADKDTDDCVADVYLTGSFLKKKVNAFFDVTTLKKSPILFWTGCRTHRGTTGMAWLYGLDETEKLKNTEPFHNDAVSFISINYDGMPLGSGPEEAAAPMIHVAYFQSHELGHQFGLVHNFDMEKQITQVAPHCHQGEVVCQGKVKGDKVYCCLLNDNNDFLKFKEHPVRNIATNNVGIMSYTGPLLEYHFQFLFGTQWFEYATRKDALNQVEPPFHAVDQMAEFCIGFKAAENLEWIQPPRVSLKERDQKVSLHESSII
jgi:hypothetical protein